MTKAELNNYKTYIIKLVEAQYKKAVENTINTKINLAGFEAKHRAYQEEMIESCDGGPIFGLEESANQLFGERINLYKKNLEIEKKEKEFLRNVMLVCSITFATTNTNEEEISLYQEGE